MTIGLVHEEGIMAPDRSGKYMRRALALALIGVFVFGAAGHASAAGVVRYAKPGGASTGSCNTWPAACTLPRALSVAVSGDTVWVVKGTHKPTNGGDRTASFALKDGVALYGGFVGTETLLSQRNPTLNVTTLSGEIGAAGNADNSYHVLRANGVTSTAVLDGFTITAGNANGAYQPANVGGGMYNTTSSPTLRNVTFSGNSASSEGGGMYNDIGSSPSLTDVAFSGNTAADHGGGMFSGGGDPSLTNVAFTGNTVTGLLSSGGAMYNNFGHPSLADVTFSSNSATLGGGMYNNSSDPALTDVTFSGNSAIDGGGGMYNNSSSPILTDVTFSSNTATGSGGGMYNIGSSPVLSSSPTLSNVTFSGNSAANSGGGMYNY
ncbi:MAG TPA: hypothetical protein VMJ64_08945, partial [Anaerolineales bacterium]|nr:hypothetical protein [Anaerolineales bacterium]